MNLWDWVEKQKKIQEQSGKDAKKESKKKDS
jgi:hypothetical protein